MNENLQKVTQAVIDMRREWLKQALKAQHLAGLLPEAIQSLKISSVDLTTDGKELQITIYGNDAYQTLKEQGVIGFNPHYSNITKFWYLTDGVLDLVPGCTAVFTVYQVDKPPRCKTEKRTRTVTEEVAVCEETGKEL